MPAGTTTTPDRKTRILDAAEQVFADCGFEGASLRQIVEAARVNLATVYYYFESKEALLEAVFTRRFGPVKAAQLDLLRQAEAAHPKAPLPVETILQALLVPPLRLATADSVEGRIAMKLIGRIVTEPSRQIQDLVRAQNTRVRLAFTEAFMRSLPRLPQADLIWRLQMIWGALAFVLCNPGRMERFTDGLCNPADTPVVLAQMIAFFSAGLRAPAVSPIQGRRSSSPPAQARCPAKPAAPGRSKAAR